MLLFNLEYLCPQAHRRRPQSFYFAEVLIKTKQRKGERVNGEEDKNGIKANERVIMEGNGTVP